MNQEIEHCGLTTKSKNIFFLKMIKLNLELNTYCAQLRFDEKKNWKWLNLELNIAIWRQKKGKICENLLNLELNIGIWRDTLCESPEI